MAILHIDDPENLRASIIDKTKEWHGVYCEEISLSVGYAAYKDKPGSTVDELERIADSDMYKEKAKYYKEKGIERRKD